MRDKETKRKLIQFKCNMHYKVQKIYIKNEKNLF